MDIFLYHQKVEIWTNKKYTDCFQNADRDLDVGIFDLKLGCFFDLKSKWLFWIRRFQCDWGIERYVFTRDFFLWQLKIKNQKVGFLKFSHKYWGYMKKSGYKSCQPFYYRQFCRSTFFNRTSSFAKNRDKPFSTLIISPLPHSDLKSL